MEPKSQQRYVMKYISEIDQFVKIFCIDGRAKEEFIASLSEGTNEGRYKELVLEVCFPQLRTIQRIGSSDDLTTFLYDAAIEVNSHLAIEEIKIRPTYQQRRYSLEEKTDFPAYFNEHIFGQPQVVEPLNTAILGYVAGIRNPNRPPAAVTMIGPTGVGKTETAEVFTEYLFGSREACLAINGAEFQLQHQVANLLGSPKGYIGYGDNTILQEFIQKNSEGVILLDEMDKAHSSVRRAFLQAMDKGVLTDNKGNVLDFRNIFLFFVANTGEKALRKLEERIGFSRKKREHIPLEEYEKLFIEQLRGAVEPAFIGRNSTILVYRPFSRETALQVAKKSLSREKSYHANGGVITEFDESVAPAVARQADFHNYGGREMERVIEKGIRDPVLEALHRGELKRGSSIKFRYRKGRFIMAGN